MIRRLIHLKLNGLEGKLGESMDYMRFVLDRSLRAFLAFGLFTRLAEYRRKLPPEPRMVAAMKATQSEDCGSCVRIAVGMAKQEGVAAEVIRATVEGRPGDLSDELADVYRFAAGVLEQRDDPQLRELMRARYGDEGLIELGYAMSSAKVFPILKRTLGYARSCSEVRVEC